jgi:heme-degrading monooxygenase HmoA
MDMAVSRLMEGVENRVRKQPGLLEYETLVDSSDATRFVVLTHWNSKEELDKWIENEWYVKKCQKMDEVLGSKPIYRVFEQPKEDIFLL